MRIGVEEEKSGDPTQLRPCSRLAILLSWARPGVFDTLYKQAQIHVCIHKYKPGHKYKMDMRACTSLTHLLRVGELL